MANILSFRGSLDEGYAGDLLFADALEAFGAGRDDPVSVAIGGYFTKISDVSFAYFCPGFSSILTEAIILLN